MAGRPAARTAPAIRSCSPRGGTRTTAALCWGSGVVSLYDVPSSITGLYSKQGQPSGDLLLRNADLSWQLTLRDQTVYAFGPGGALQRIVSPQGNAVDLTYQGGSLSRITDRGSGRYLQIGYYQSGADAGRINTVTDNTGRSIAYRYTAGDLTTFTDVAGNSRTFTYHPGSLMHTATDQVGNTFITNLYDPQRRVVHQKDGRAAASGQSYDIAFAYQDVTAGGVACVQTTVTDRMGNVAVHVSQQETRNTISELRSLPGGAVWRVLRAFDGVGNLIAQTVYEGPAGGDPAAGNTTRYTYDGARNILSITDPLGKTARFTYDARNNLVSGTDRDGNLTAIAYVPGTNLVQSITDPAGRKLVFTYRPAGTAILGLPDSITWYPAGDGGGAAGNVTHNLYASTGDLVQVTDPLGTVIRYAYDTAGAGWLTSTQVKDALGAVAVTVGRDPWPGTGLTQRVNVQYPGQTAAWVTTTTFDANGQLITRQDPLQRITRWHHDANGGVDQLTWPGTNPDVTRWVRDRNDQVIQEILSPASPSVSTGQGWDVLGRLSSVTDGNQQTTTLGQRMDVKPVGTPCPTIFTITSPAVTIHPPVGPTRTERYAQLLTYDALGRLIAFTDRAVVGTPGPVTTIDHASVPGPGGTVHQQITTTFPKADPAQPQPFTTVAVHDAVGRLVSRTDERGKVWSVAYTTELDPATRSTRTVATTTDPVGNQVVEVTDARGRVVVTRTGRSSVWRVVTTAFDALDRPVRVEEPNPVPNPPSPTVATALSYVYDPASQCLKITVTPYGSPPSTYLLDAADQWVGYTDAHGIAIAMTYTARGQLSTWRNGRQQTVTYGHDKAGRFVTAALPDGSVVEQVLDGNDRRLQTKVGGAPQLARAFDELGRLISRTQVARGETVAYTYTATDLLDSLLYPGGKAVTYAYDGMRRPRTVVDWGARTAAYTWAPNGALAGATLPNQVTTSCSQDDAGNFSGFQTTIGAALVASAAYTRNELGLPVQIDQLLPFAPALPATGHAFTYVDADRMAQADATALGYDGDGNVTTAPGVTGALAHDVFGQLISAGTVGFDLDADGLLDRRRDGATARHYLQDPARCSIAPTPRARRSRRGRRRSPAAAARPCRPTTRRRRAGCPARR
jgi:YD repeat-containing protein